MTEVRISAAYTPQEKDKNGKEFFKDSAFELVSQNDAIMEFAIKGGRGSEVSQIGNRIKIKGLEFDDENGVIVEWWEKTNRPYYAEFPANEWYDAFGKGESKVFENVENGEIIDYPTAKADDPRTLDFHVIAQLKYDKLFTLRARQTVEDGAVKFECFYAAVFGGLDEDRLAEVKGGLHAHPEALDSIPAASQSANCVRLTDLFKDEKIYRFIDWD